VRKLVVGVLIFLIVVLLAVDVGSRLWVQQKMASTISRQVPGVRKVQAEISSFPFLGRLFLLGDVSKVTIKMQDVTTDLVDISQLRASVTGAKLDRGRLMGGHITVTKVSKVAVAAVLSDADLSQAAHVSVHVTTGKATVEVAGVHASVSVAVQGRYLTLGAAGVSVHVPIPAEEYMPCVPGVQLEEGQAVLACTSDHLPSVVVQAIGSVNLQGH
jgi:hypothetical protein